MISRIGLVLLCVNVFFMATITAMNTRPLFTLPQWAHSIVFMILALMICTRLIREGWDKA